MKAATIYKISKLQLIRQS